MRLAAASALAAALTGAILSACAPTAKIGEDEAASTDRASTARCFRTDMIRNFRADGRSNLYIRSNRNDVFKIDAAAGCWDLDNALSIAVVSTSGGSDNVCVGDPVLLIVPGSTPGQGTCRAFVGQSLTTEEVAALSDRARP